MRDGLCGVFDAIQLPVRGVKLATLLDPAIRGWPAVARRL